MRENQKSAEGAEIENKEKERGNSESKATIAEGSLKSLFNARIAGLFLLGLLVGVTVKTQALKTITMGFEDYKLDEMRSEFKPFEDVSLEAEGQEEAGEESSFLDKNEEAQQKAGDEEATINGILPDEE